MAKKIQLQDANGNVLHPLTLGECVTMDNGENLDTLMSKSQMFTPTITQDKSMFKVGAGVDVDYSVNVKDGAYESLAFKGKSLVNVVDYNSKTFNEGNTIEDGVVTITHRGEYYSNTFFLTPNNIKPSTDYFVIFDVISNTYANSVKLMSDDDKACCFDYSLTIQAMTTGLYKMKVTSKSDLSSCRFLLRTFGYNNTNNGSCQYRVMVIEYQEGMEDWDIPYFEGLCDVKMPILRNVGENLFDPNNTLPDNLNYFYNSNNQNQLTTHAQMLSCAIPVTKGKTYSFYFNHDEVPLKVHKSAVFPTFKSGGLGGNGYRHDVRTITASMDGYFGIMFCYTEDGNTDNWTKVARDWKKQLKLTIVEAGNVNAHVPYESNILRTSEEIVLREVNGVQDTYNPLTGEYVKRTGEIVLDGSENWGVGSLIGDTMRFGLTAQGHKIKTSSDGLCDKIPYIKWNSEDVEHVRADGTTPYGRINVWIKTGRLSTADTQGFKQWLQQNPLTVQYELAEPEITFVKPSTMTPFAYQNGHVIVESGFEGQSLLPEIEYSVVTGRTGQVTQNTKVLRQQEQQIIGLEELLLTQVVQMEYERTLLQFDYELQMMMLG